MASTTDQEEVLERIEAYSLSDLDIKRILGRGCKIIKYSELSKYATLELLLPKHKSYVVILIEAHLNEGHWIGLCRFKDNYLYFDSYGNKIDADLNWTSSRERIELNENANYLTNLINISPLDCLYNNVRYQQMSQHINTCGLHVSHFLYRMKHQNMDLKKYYLFMKHLKDESGHSYDDIVATFGAQFLKIKL